MNEPISARLLAACQSSTERLAWLERLPITISELLDRWELSLEPSPGSYDPSCSWVAPVERLDGTRAVLKLGMPHMEGEDELHGLRFWDGDPTVRVLEGDVAANAMLLECCEPGVSLRSLPEPEQDVVIAGLLRRLWRTPAIPHPFRPLATMTAYWAGETRAAEHRWPDAGLVREGLDVFDTMSRPSPDDVLLATDLHAGNVLSASRAPWIVIDPKPFVGDRAYDATQHLFNCPDRLRADALGTIRRVADLLGVDDTRVRLWMFARLIAEPRQVWRAESLALARSLA